MRKKRKTRRFWVRQWISRRNQLGASEGLLKEIALEDKEEYRNHLRMSEKKIQLTPGKSSGPSKETRYSNASSTLTKV